MAAEGRCSVGDRPHHSGWISGGRRPRNIDWELSKDRKSFEARGMDKFNQRMCGWHGKRKAR